MTLHYNHELYIWAAKQYMEQHLLQFISACFALNIGVDT